MRIALAFVCLVGVGFVGAMLLHLGDDSPTVSGRGSAVASELENERSAAALTPLERRLRQDLERGVEEAAALGGDVEAAVMLDGSPSPLVATSEAGGAERQMRMWSISKVATMITFLRLLGWGDRPGEIPSPEALEGLVGALTRSENCRQRRVVLELQRAAGGIPQTRQALSETFALADSKATPGTQVEAPESLCVPYLSQQLEIPQPLAPTLLLGTSQWRVSDAVRLAHALADGTYGKALSEMVLELMEAPKRPSRESEPGELTAPIDWGAGTVFKGFAPAYKAGWGGTLNGNFLAGQIAIVHLQNGDDLALAVMFHPDTQPERDDPGITSAPAAIETVMEAVSAGVSPSPEGSGGPSVEGS
ncbi:MAG TPA: hypothetical protein VI039_08630 [Solirubrobacterales bacterium]